MFARQTLINSSNQVVQLAIGNFVNIRNNSAGLGLFEAGHFVTTDDELGHRGFGLINALITLYVGANGYGKARNRAGNAVIAAVGLLATFDVDSTRVVLDYSQIPICTLHTAILGRDVVINIVFDLLIVEAVINQGEVVCSRTLNHGNTGHRRTELIEGMVKSHIAPRKRTELRSPDETVDDLQEIGIAFGTLIAGVVVELPDFAISGVGGVAGADEIEGRVVQTGESGGGALGSADLQVVCVEGQEVATFTLIAIHNQIIVLDFEPHFGAQSEEVVVIVGNLALIELNESSVHAEVLVAEVVENGSSLANSALQFLNGYSLIVVGLQTILGNVFWNFPADAVNIQKLVLALQTLAVTSQGETRQFRWNYSARTSTQLISNFADFAGSFG